MKGETRLTRKSGVWNTAVKKRTRKRKWRKENCAEKYEKRNKE
jgi:hypothetical protein